MGCKLAILLISFLVVASFISFVYAESQVNACDSLTSWTTFSGTDQLEGSDKQEGTNSINFTGDGAGTIMERLNPAGTWDWSGNDNVTLWVKPDTLTDLAVWLLTDGGNKAGWNLDDEGAQVGTWIEVTIELDDPDSEQGSLDLSSIDQFDVRMGQPVGFESCLIDDIRLDYVPVGGQELSFPLFENFNVWDSHSKTMELSNSLFEAFNVWPSLTVGKEQGFTLFEPFNVWSSLSYTTEGIAQDLAFILFETVFPIASIISSVAEAYVLEDALALGAIAFVLAIVAICLLFAFQKKS